MNKIPGDKFTESTGQNPMTRRVVRDKPIDESKYSELTEDKNTFSGSLPKLKFKLGRVKYTKRTDLLLVGTKIQTKYTYQ